MAPLLLLTYGLLRHVDGRDADHGPGVAWKVGHTFMLAAFCLAVVITLVSLTEDYLFYIHFRW